ncbi:MAG: response regulator [Taibaiella sp.]|nr:response regulator [Taibaiella sp.]
MPATNVKVGVVEDDLVAAQGIINVLNQLGYIATGPAVSYSEALEMIEKEQPDILLLDIMLHGIKDGIELAQKVREDYDIPFLFLTGNSDAATVERAKKILPAAYLVKPFSKNELFASIEVCLYNYSFSKQNASEIAKDNYIIKDCLFIKQAQNFYKVKIEEILYLQSDNVYIYVHTTNNKLIVRSTIQHYLKLINKDFFYRVHRSFAINMNHVVTISAENVIIGGREIPISKVYRDELLKTLRIG